MKEFNKEKNERIRRLKREKKLKISFEIRNRERQSIGKEDTLCRRKSVSLKCDCVRWLQQLLGRSSQCCISGYWFWGVEHSSQHFLKNLD